MFQVGFELTPQYSNGAATVIGKLLILGSANFSSLLLHPFPGVHVFS
jgi:hypothetical protein